MSRMPRAVYEVVMERAAGVCEAMVPGVCTGRAEHWHHRRMRSQGGAHEVVNGLGVCAGCHGFFHAHPAHAYEAGWLVRSVDDPAVVPVSYRGRWVTLDASGGVTPPLIGADFGSEDLF